MLKLRESGYPSKVILIFGGRTESFDLKFSPLPTPSTPHHTHVYLEAIGSLSENFCDHTLFIVYPDYKICWEICLISNIFSSLANSILFLSLLYPLCFPTLWLARSYSIWDTWLFGPRLINFNFLS